jgi:hypothetical protein
MTALGRLAGLFLAPAQRAPAPAPVVARLTAVLAPAPDLAPTAGAVAATLRRAAASRTALVLVLAAAPPPPRVATPAAAGLARRLAARDLRATAAGVLCQVELSPDPATAARDVWRIAGAADVPMVLALPARLDGFDDLLSRFDRLVLALPPGTDDALADLALASLAGLGPPATRTEPPAGLLTRRVATLGLAAIRLEAPGEPARGAAVAREPVFEPPRAELRA